MRNLKVWQKLALMGVIFLIPFALVTMKMVSAIDTLGVDFAAQELHGLDFTRPALTLVKDLQQHRDVASIVLNGEAGYRSRLEGVRADVEKDLAEIDELDKRFGTVLRTTARWKTMRVACTELLAKSIAAPSISSATR